MMTNETCNQAASVVIIEDSFEQWGPRPRGSLESARGFEHRLYCSLEAQLPTSLADGDVPHVLIHLAEALTLDQHLAADGLQFREMALRQQVAREVERLEVRQP